MDDPPKDKALVVIWGALLAGVAMFMVVAFVLTADGTIEPVLDANRVSLFALAMIAPLALSFALPRILRDRIPRDAGPEDRAMQERMAVIIGLAMAEGAGLGLISVAMLGGNTSWILVGGLGTLLVMTMQKP